MGLEPPTLDDRTYEGLLEDAIRQIPNHTDAWTDHNPSDPGITILEVLAWVAESEIYRLDQITDEHLRRYLHLLGVEPRPPTSATVSLEVEPPSDLAGSRIEAGEQLLAATDDGELLAYRVDEDVVLSDASVDAVVSVHSRSRRDHTRANDGDGRYFRAFGADATVGSACYLGFDRDPFDDAQRLDCFVDLHEENVSAPSVHGPATDGEPIPSVPDPSTAGDDDPVARALSRLAEPSPDDFEPSAGVRWEHCTDVGNWRDESTWEPFDAVRDGTNQLYRSGAVELDEPEAWAGTPGDPFELGPDRYWIRCVVTTPGYEIPPQVDSIHTNVLGATHALERSDERLQTPDGETVTSARPDQTFEFESAPILDATITVGGEEWTAVFDFAGSDPDDHQYVLDRTAGTVRFGNGITGEVPEPDLAVRATRCVYGGGRDGTVPGDAEWRFDDAALEDLDITDVTRRRDGRDAESLEEAIARARRDLARPYRAITRSDVRAVATNTPGLRFGRTAVYVDDPDDSVGRLDGKHEDTASSGSNCGAHGTMRVVVVPESTEPRPIPSQGFLDAVDCHLQRHRLLTDRIEVERPTYVGVGVDVSVELQEGYDEDRRIDAVERAIDDFLDPLDGFDGDGWPFGRPVYDSELYEVVGDVEGVDCVHDVSTTGSGSFEVDDGSILVGEEALVYPLEHEVHVQGGPDPCRRWNR